MPFTPPKQNAFKQFVLLDSESVISALSAIDGGQIDEILTRNAEEKSGGFGAEANVKVAKGGGKRAKTRKVEEEMRITRTRHAAAAKLLEALHQREAIGIVEGVFDSEVAENVENGMVLEFRADLRLHPLHQADQMLRSYIEVGPKLDQKETVKELRGMLDIWGVIVGTGKEDAAVLFEPATSEPQKPRLLMPSRKSNLEVGVDDVLGEITVVAQVEQTIGGDETHQVVRVLGGGPATSMERNVIDEMLPALIEGMAGIGINVQEDDINVHGPALVLRPLCAYR